MVGAVDSQPERASFFFNRMDENLCYSYLSYQANYLENALLQYLFRRKGCRENILTRIFNLALDV